VTVLLNGEYVVFQGITRHLATTVVPKDGLNAVQLRLDATDAPITTSSGKIAGLLASRDTILGGFLTQLNDFTKVVMNEFNKVYSSGQGLTGYRSVVSERAVSGTQAPLDAAGLVFTPTNGSFQIKVKNEKTGVVSTQNIQVDLNGLGDDTTLESLTSQINAIDGISATIDESRHLRITSDSATTTFSFANDTSGVLASLGINTFFTGSGANDIGVSDVLRADASKFAASQEGVGEDSKVAEKLANLLTTAIPSHDGASISVLYDRMTSDVAQGSAVAKSVTEGYRTFQTALEGQHMAVSGVSIDEEAVRMVAYQRAFQASAKFISVVSEMLDMLVKL
jgi:flagellar hook-associated protein 1 FlgK